MFSYARNSCHRNHNHYTLCAHHHNEEHDGEWKTCAKCRSSFTTENYVWYGTNEYNFEKFHDPPAYEPTNAPNAQQSLFGARMNIQSWEKTISAATAPTSESCRSRRERKSKGAARRYLVPGNVTGLSLPCWRDRVSAIIATKNMRRPNEDREHKRGQR